VKPTVTLDTTQFNTVLKEIVKQSSRTAVDVINGRLFAVVIKAIKFTKKADPDKIAQVLGQVGTQLKYTKKRDRLLRGRRSKGRAVLREDSFAARIVNARRRDYAGADYMLHGNALEAAAQKLIAARRRSVAFIASGWTWAVRQLIPFVKFKSGVIFNTKGIVTAGRPKGSALPAKGASATALRQIVASATNTALIGGGGRFQAKGPHNPMPIAEAGLVKALADEKFEMERHLREKFIKELRRLATVQGG